MSDEQPSNALLLNIIQQVGIVQGQNDLILQEQGRAAAGRKEIHEKMEELRSDVAGAVNKIETTTNSVTAMKPHVDEWVKVYQNVRGGLVVIAAIGALLFAAIGFVIKDFWVWIKTHVTVN